MESQTLCVFKVLQIITLRICGKKKAKENEMDAERIIMTDAKIKLKLWYTKYFRRLDS